MNIFDAIKKEHFIELAGMAGFSDLAEDLYADYLIHNKNHDSKTPLPSRTQELQNFWYESLSGEPQYGVYNNPFYLCDLWLCWKTYSRSGLMALQNPKSMFGKTVPEYMGKIGKVLDLGCGFGYSTAGLKAIFKDAEATGTNLKSSFQFPIAQKIGERYGFTVVEDSKDVGQVDLAMASEYFEHIHAPLEHLHHIFAHNRPKYFVIANGFNGTAIGHFNHYTHQGQTYTNREMSKLFLKEMRQLGYKKLKTKIWNNRPSVWELD